MSGKQSNDTRDIYVLQDPPEGHRAEFDWGYVDLVILGSLRKIPLAMFILNFSQYRFGNSIHHKPLLTLFRHTSTFLTILEQYHRQSSVTMP
jgi:hypothetical protein